MFTMHIDTSIDIEATPGEIWQVLTDLNAYDQWNPMLNRVRSSLAPGSRVSFQVQRDSGSPLKLEGRIRRLSECRHLAWRGGSVLFICGEHYFRIEQLHSRLCRLHHGEYFKGLFLPLLRPMLRKGEALYLAMNTALKQRVQTLQSTET